MFGAGGSMESQPPRIRFDPDRDLIVDLNGPSPQAAGGRLSLRLLQKQAIHDPAVFLPGLGSESFNVVDYVFELA